MVFHEAMVSGRFYEINIYKFNLRLPSDKNSQNQEFSKHTNTRVSHSKNIPKKCLTMIRVLKNQGGITPGGDFLVISSKITVKKLDQYIFLEGFVQRFK